MVFLSQQHVLDDVLPELVVQPEVEADDEARDQHHRRAADQRLLARPLDLLELRHRLLDEVREAGAWGLPLLRDALGAARLVAAVRRRARSRPHRRPTRERRLRLRPPGAALLTGLPSHALSASLPVDGVAAAPAAVLLELDPVGRVPLRLLRLIVAPLA